MELIPVRPNLEDNQQILVHKHCEYHLYMSVDFYKTIGFNPPWICYFAKKNGQFVGTGAFKGKPINNQVEIAYATFKAFQNKGIGTEICKQLVNIAQTENNSVEIKARTIPEINFSTQILIRNNFVNLGSTIDPDVGEVWDWHYKSST